MSKQHSSTSTTDPGDFGHNDSCNPAFAEVLASRMDRRTLLKGGFYLMAASVFGSALAGCGEDKQVTKAALAPVAKTPPPVPVSGLALSFKPVAKSVADVLSVPEGYTATVLLATGDPLKAGVSAYKNDGTDNDFEVRAGDHHDGMFYFGLNAAGTGWDASNAQRGLLCLNHEVAEDLGFMHPAGATDLGTGNVNARPVLEIDKEVAAHGVSIVEIARSGNGYQTSLTNPLNRRVTAATVMELSGVAAGSELMKTAFSQDGLQTRGTLNNCSNGYTPWGTYLTCEENWAEYFHRREADSARTPQELVAFKRYGMKGDTSGRYNWSRPGASDSTDLYRRWNAGITGATATDDFRNVANTFGWVVEIDPFNPQATPKKRTALGRFAHEGCVPAKAEAGKPLVFYMGDDSRNEYIYKFVTDAKWDAADANGGLAAGDKYLNAGKLYAARFNADGSDEWLLLTLDNAAVAQYDKYAFADAADVAIHTRLAADAVGATKMDRPEWAAVNPLNGEVYITLTNNVSEKNGRGVAMPLDAANQRYYVDEKDGKRVAGNVNGHIIRWREAGDDHAATRFQWDVYLFGAPAEAGADINLSGLTADNDFSGPDGLWFSQSTPGLLWVQTDDAYYTDVTNCMMLAAIPGVVGDGNTVQVVNKAVPTHDNADQAIGCPVGSKPQATALRRFLVGPKDCEITGITETPDGKALLVNIQHPGERSSETWASDGNITSHWPDGGNARPRSATVVITRNDGGKVGV